MNSVVSAPSSAQFDSLTWLVTAFRAVAHDSWLGIQKARTKGLKSKAPWTNWCYASDKDLAKYVPMPRGSVVTKGIGLCAWMDVRQVYGFPADILEAVASTPLPKDSYLRQYMAPSDLALYITTPHVCGLLSPHGKETHGVLGYWLRGLDGRRELALLFNLGDDSSLLTIPDHGSLRESLVHMRFPRGTEIPPDKLRYVHEVLSLFLFAAAYREVDEDPAIQRDGYEFRLLGRRVANAQGACKLGRWIPVDGDFAWVSVVESSLKTASAR